MCNIYFRAYLHGDTHTHTHAQSVAPGNMYICPAVFVFISCPFCSPRTTHPTAPLLFGVYFANIYKLTSIISRGACALASACLIRTCQIKHADACRVQLSRCPCPGATGTGMSESSPGAPALRTQHLCLHVAVDGAHTSVLCVRACVSACMRARVCVCTMRLIQFMQIYAMRKLNEPCVGEAAPAVRPSDRPTGPGRPIAWRWAD